MTEANDIPSIVERTRPVKAGAAVVAVHFLGLDAVFVLGEQALLLVSPEGQEKRLAIHGGAILSSAADADRIVTGGDDGKVVSTDANAVSTILATDPRQRWIDNVAIGPNGALAWSAGKQAFARAHQGVERKLELPSTVGGLDFAPKGFRLAVAHYNGATLWFPDAHGDPEVLKWNGSHLCARFSPDGRFLVTAMQEPTLHGWRLSDRRDMRMSGYEARVRSLEWTAGGKWLATSGSTQLILWPFQGKDGPMGKAPQILAPAKSQVEVVACHPKEEVVAVGYADGLVLVVRVADGAEVLARRPDASMITALAWSAAGNMLAWGSEDGDAGVVAIA